MAVRKPLTEEEEFAAAEKAREALEARRASAEAGAPERGEAKPGSLSMTLGLGDSGPNFVKIGGKLLQIGPFTLRSLPLANASISQLSVTSGLLMLAWSNTPAAEALDPGAVAELYQRSIPGDSATQVTVEDAVAAATGDNMNVSQEEIDALINYVGLSVRRYKPEITDDFLLDNLDYPEALKIAGKILSLNTGLKQRFLSPSA